MKEEVITCPHLKPVVKWYSKVERDNNGRPTAVMYIPHVHCDTCGSRLQDTDPIAKYYIERALKGLENDKTTK